MNDKEKLISDIRRELGTQYGNTLTKSVIDDLMRGIAFIINGKPDKEPELWICENELCKNNQHKYAHPKTEDCEVHGCIPYVAEAEKGGCGECIYENAVSSNYPCKECLRDGKFTNFKAKRLKKAGFPQGKSEYVHNECEHGVNYSKRNDPIEFGRNKCPTLIEYDAPTEKELMEWLAKSEKVKDEYKAKAETAISLVDGAKTIVELWEAKTPAQIVWKREWLEQARTIMEGERKYKPVNDITKIRWLDKESKKQRKEDRRKGVSQSGQRAERVGL